MLLGIKTDNPVAELVLLADDGKAIEKTTWQADRTLARDLLKKINELLERQNSRFADLRGLFVYKGPGSFTGLRIGLTVMNTLAYSEHIPVVGTSGDDWVEGGTERLLAGDNDRVVLPEYGADARITTPKK